MTENDPAALARTTYEGLVAAKAEYLPGEVAIILDIAKMSDSDIAGAVKQAHVVHPLKGGRRNTTYFTADNVLHLFVANKLANETRARLEEKAASLKKKPRFFWSSVDARTVNRLAEKEIETIFYQSEVGQEVVKKMAEVARSKAE